MYFKDAIREMMIVAVDESAARLPVLQAIYLYCSMC
jgi:hypothetical protein